MTIHEERGTAKIYFERNGLNVIVTFLALRQLIAHSNLVISHCQVSIVKCTYVRHIRG